MNTNPQQCETNCAGHSTLDVLASRPVACLFGKATSALVPSGGWDASSTAVWLLYRLYIGLMLKYFFIHLADVMLVR